MNSPARSRSPVPGRTWIATALCVAAAGCSVDEPVRPLKQEGPRAAPAVAVGQGASIRRFSDFDDDSLWTYIKEAGGLVDVGLRQPGRQSGMQRGRVLLSAGELLAARNAVARVPGTKVLSADTLLPIVQARLADRGALTLLRRLPDVEYVEPGAFVGTATSRGVRWNDIDWGCSIHEYGGPGGNTYINGGDVLPWNYRVMGIDSAWAYSTGRGVTVGLVDTGVDQDVWELTTRFADGMSAGRTFTKEATKPYAGSVNTWHDTCGHGTRMASVVGAPMNGWSIAGVAWGANLHAVRVDDDVIFSEVDATRLGIRRAAKMSRVVTMAFGTYFHYTSIAQELDHWYYNTERIIFAAAGTSPCWDPVKTVTFPAYLHTVTTVTAFDGTGSLACNAHWGPEVDFAAYTDQPAQGLITLGMSLAGLAGSSGATAVMAGMTALYLSRKPEATRMQTISALTSAASPTGGKHPMWGFGVPNAMCLMDEMCTAWIEGPTLIQSSGMYTWTAYQMKSPGPMSYQWNTGETSQSITRYVTVTPGMLEYSFNVGVTVRDTRNGRARVDNKPVVVRAPNGCPTCF